VPQAITLLRAHTYTRTYANVGDWSLEDLKGDDNIKIGPKEVISEKVYRIHLAQDSVQWQVVMNMVMSFRAQ
jgi:hypothetical protein